MVILIQLSWPLLESTWLPPLPVTKSTALRLQPKEAAWFQRCSKGGTGAWTECRIRSDWTGTELSDLYLCYWAQARTSVP